MQEQMDAVEQFHDKMDVSAKQPWGEGTQLCKNAGNECLEYASMLLPYVSLNPQSLRNHLLLEELGEFLTAETEVEALDALTDLLYVLLGTAVTYGWDLSSAFNEVHRSNMSKEKQPDDIHSERVRDKGPNYSPPNLEPFINVPS